MEMLFWVFSKPDKVIISHIMMTAILYIVVPLVQIVDKTKMSPYIFVPLYLAIQVSLYFVGVSMIWVHKFAPASAMIVSTEMARMTMKAHAYFREKVLYGIYKDTTYANFIPKWAVQAGI